MEKSIYETPIVIARYIESEWAEFFDSAIDEDCPHSLFRFCDRNSEFYKSAAAVCLKYYRRNMRVIEVGCSTGRLLHELISGGVSELMAADTSVPFLSIVSAIFSRSLVLSCSAKLEERLSDVPFLLYSRLRACGEVKTLPLTTFLSALPEVKTPCKLSLVEKVPDGNDIEFDLVISLNVLDRVPEPLAFASNLGALVKRDGILITSTPFDWNNAQFGGVSDASHRRSRMCDYFSRDFDLLEELELDYVFRTSERRVVLNKSQLAVLQKR